VCAHGQGRPPRLLCHQPLGRFRDGGKISRSADAKIAQPADDEPALAAYVREVNEQGENMISRIALIVTGLAVGLWEGVDIFWIDVPAVAAVFAALFLGCTLWIWRRQSLRAAVALLVLFAFEAAVAPSLKHVMTLTKVAAFTLALAGVASASAVLVAGRRAKRASAHGLAQAG
jgi:hypothetical protein